MSETLSVARRNVRQLLRDLNPTPFAFAGTEVDRALIASSLKVGSQIGLGFDWDTGVVTLTVGSTADYTLGAATTQWDRVILARIADTGETLEKVSVAEINEMREGLISTSGGGGDPSAFALWEDATQIVQMRIDTIPTAARTIDFLRSNMPSGTIADSTTLPFSDLGLRAVEFDAAAALAGKASQAILEKLGLGPGAVQVFASNYMDCMKEDRARRVNLTRRNYGVGRILGR